MNPSPASRLRIVVRGAVQGVGFRPFVFRLATGLQLAGWVNNSPQGVFIEVEGARPALEQLLLRLDREKPPRSSIQSLEPAWLDAVGFNGFEIRASETGGAKQALVLPDIATCPDCLREIFDPANRRFGYAFTNCTNCGPRFSIIESLPYDRANTTMRGFGMCAECRAEYENPLDRRFHAQPNACPACGPQLAFWSSGTGILPVRVGAGAEATPDRQDACPTTEGAPLLAAARAIRDGAIVAVKGIGGFHLLCAAHDDAAIRRLRERKEREEKPFAVMFPSLDAVRAGCDVSPLEERLLASPEAPIVLLKRHHASRITHHGPHISPLVAPQNPQLGCLLPSNPLHHLLLRELGFAVVATSGNLSDEPICTDEREAVARLGGIADFLLVHNRPIARHVDDSIVRVMAGRELVLRRARGYAPLPISLVGADVRRLTSNSTAESGQEAVKLEPPHVGCYETVLAVGAHLKNTVALAVGEQVFISQHIGDLENEPSLAAFKQVTADLQRLYEAAPGVIACDAHPDYLSTKFAEEFMGRTARPTRISIQHHVAHVLSCMAENELEPPALGVSWDGTGFGLDGTVWGGEFFEITESEVDGPSFGVPALAGPLARLKQTPDRLKPGLQTGGWRCHRFAHLRPFRLPGGEAAVKEPRRAALGLLFEAFGEAAFEMRDVAAINAFEPSELAALRQMLVRGVNSPLTSSAGRLFDAVASLAGLRQVTRFEGQSAMALEFAAEEDGTEEIYDLRFTIYEPPQSPTPSSILHSPSSLQLDWQPLIEALLADARGRVLAGVVAAKFHNALAGGIVAVAKRAGHERVALSGGCFQNRRLLERTVARLTSEGFRPYWHQRVPPNDGGVSLGQIVAARRGLGIP
jgi:hydrogenase maturation protein HypF